MHCFYMFTCGSWQAVFVLSELYDVMGDHLALQFGPQKDTEGFNLRWP